MLIEFTVSNFKSFNQPVTLSMVAAPLSEHQPTHIYKESGYTLLKSVIIYGANASGKSNLLKAIYFMRRMVLSSANETQISDKIGVDRFKLIDGETEKPASFEIVFLIEGKRYRYGFQVTEDEVCAEWLFYVPSTKEARLFTRESNKFSLGARFKEGSGLQDKTRNNALFLSVVAQFNGEISKKIIRWFSNLNIISGIDDVVFHYTVKKLQDPEFKKWILTYLKLADIDIVDIAVEPVNIELVKLPAEIQRLVSIQNQKETFIQAYNIKTYHPKYDKNHSKMSPAVFDFENNESKGTQRIIALAGPIWDTLKNGKILFIDEFESRLHHQLSVTLTKLFNSAKANCHQAQFVLATHDTNLMKNELFRRDQIWFIQKKQNGESDLYSMVEYKESSKTIRKDATYNRSYLQGRFGAVPIIGDFEDLFGDDRGE